jgi:N-acylglucosamine-6-phosphate 2-epimerase
MPITIPRGLIVSCQAEPSSPFNSPEFIVAFAKAAEIGGAIGLRLRGVENIVAVKKTTKLPIIGITKSQFPTGEVLITGTIEEVEAIIEAGADVVALDGTTRIRPNGMNGFQMIQEVKKRFTLPVMADVATFDEGIEAVKGGADFIGTTLSGYTDYTQKVRKDFPDFELIEKLAKLLPGKVIAEGRFWTPEQVALALKMGAYAVVVGTAITRPIDIVKRFAGGAKI